MHNQTLMFNGLFSSDKSGNNDPEVQLEVVRLPAGLGSSMWVERWLKQKGEWVRPGDLMAEVESDTAAFELDSYSMGYLLYRAEEKKQMVAGDIVAITGPRGSEIQPILQAEPDQRTPYVRGMAGEIRLVATEQIPQNWLPCDGRQLHTADYPKLFAAIGSRFGSVLDRFSLPEMKAPDHRLRYIICVE